MLIFYLYLKWKFIYSLGDFLRAWYGFLKFGLNIFSVPILIKTFISPWHRYHSSYPDKFDPMGVFYTFFGNLMSRVIGIILRTFFILFGIVFDFFIFIFGLFLFLIWLLLPFIILYLFWLGFLFLF